jgi:alkanesulfonate monooxygenase SsuD/methylene tetrahydromethanopterin reductase-like flavin-dependent oxidoreductase (luciferase family)
LGDDALINDPVSGIFADSDKIHTIDHVGKHFRVRGPLNVARSPQGRPVYVQAGSSDDGRAFAAHFAEAIFTAHQTLASAQEFYADIKRQAGAFGRAPARSRFCRASAPSSPARKWKPIACRRNSTILFSRNIH